MRRIYLPVFVLFSLACNSESSRESNPSEAAIDSTEKLNFLRRQVEQFPDSNDLRVQLAVELESREQYDMALNEYDNLLIQDSTNTLWYNRKASLFLKTGDTASAISTLQHSIDQNPEQPELFLELGYLYADQNDKKALVIAEQILKVSEDVRIQTQARYLKGIYFSNTGEKEKAIKAFDECIVNDYTFIDAYLEKGILLYEQKKFPDALSIFEKARSISNTNADAYFWTAKTLESMNRKDEAIEFYKKALGLDGTLTEAETALKNLERK